MNLFKDFKNENKYVSIKVDIDIEDDWQRIFYLSIDILYLNIVSVLFPIS